jgi:hypothetical protein
MPYQSDTITKIRRYLGVSSNKTQYLLIQMASAEANAPDIVAEIEGTILPELDALYEAKAAAATDLGGIKRADVVEYFPGGKTVDLDARERYLKTQLLMALDINPELVGLTEGNRLYRS